MNWEEFVNGERSEQQIRAKSQLGLLLEIVEEVAHHSTLANWVRATNSKIGAQ